MDESDGKLHDKKSVGSFHSIDEHFDEQNEKKDLSEKGDKKYGNFSQNSLNYLIEEKKKLIKRKSDHKVYENQAIKPSMQHSCQLDQISDNYSNEDENQNLKANDIQDIFKFAPKKAHPKPLTIENKNVFSSKKSPHSGLLDNREPISPNRTILFYDFLKTKFGETKFSQVMLIIEQYNNPNKEEKYVSKEDYEKMKEIIGENDAKYIIKFLRYIVKFTPKASGFNTSPNHQSVFDFSNSPKNINNNNEQNNLLKSPSKINSYSKY